MTPVLGRPYSSLLRARSEESLAFSESNTGACFAIQTMLSENCVKLSWNPVVITVKDVLQLPFVAMGRGQSGALQPPEVHPRARGHAVYPAAVGACVACF